MKELFKLIENENINIEYKHIDNANALTLILGNITLIWINADITDRITEKMTLAEEIAHHFVGIAPSEPYATDYYNKLIRSQNEHRAFLWMQKNLLPENIKRTDFNNIWEVAEKYEVSPEFVEKVFKYREGIDIK